MNKVYTTQDYLRIELLYNEDIPDSVSTAKIKYIDPNDVEGEWNAVHDYSNQVVYYDLPSGEPLTIPGTWTVWSFLTFSDGRVLPGSPASFTVVEEGKKGCNNNNCY